MAKTTKSNDVILTELKFMKSMFEERFNRLERSVARINANMKEDYVTKRDLGYELAPIKEKQKKTDSTTTWFIRIVLTFLITAIFYAIGFTR